LKGSQFVAVRFETRKQELLTDCQVPPGAFRGASDRLEGFAQPFVTAMSSAADRKHARTYIAGLVSDLPRKNAEAIAYRYDLDRQTIQEFIGCSGWERDPLRTELAIQIGRELGRPDGVIVIDPSAFPKKGTASVGVQRQWCGRLGKVENCQLAVYLGYVSEVEHALVDVRLFLPEEWATDKARRKAAGVPKEVRFKTRHELALEMLDEHGTVLPHGWVSGDDELGRPTWFRRSLRERGERYLLAVPSNTTIRDLEAEPPPYGGQGRHPKVAFRQVRDWCASLPGEAWEHVVVRDAEKGPLEVDVVIRRVQAKEDRRVADFEEVLVVVRSHQGGQTKHDYYLSNAERTESAAGFARVAKAEHRIEECLKRSKGEAGLGDYQVRNWDGWHNHQVLSLIASWFLVEESRRGKKNRAGVDAAAGPCSVGADLPASEWLRHRGADRAGTDTMAGAERAGTAVPLQVA
jgi:SRSO17 transposase